jgi:very-short-patch-repair endonuclease
MKISKSMKKYRGKRHWCYGRKRTKETKNKISKSRLGKYGGKNNPFFGKHHTKKFKIFISKANTGRTHTLNKFQRKEISKRQKELWADPIYAKRIILKMRKDFFSQKRNPTSLEIKVMNMLKKLKIKFRFTGNSRFMIGKKFPDILLLGFKKVIEVNGWYWHKGETNKNIKSYYKKYGYECLVLWQKEINKNSKLVEFKIKRFLK